MIDLFIESSAEIIDRSSLEPWATCPQQAWHLAHGVKHFSISMDKGTEVHEVIAAAMKERQTNGTQFAQLRDLMSELAMKSRPDVQPQVISVIRRCMYSVLDLICRHPTGNERHPDDLLAYDGGEGDRTGQMAADLTVDGITYRLTCECDLVLATASETEIDVTDFKSGWTWYTASDVQELFQAVFYVVVLFHRFPNVNRINFSIFMCGENQATSPVAFKREDMYAMTKRIESAIRLRKSYLDAEKADLVEAWPDESKCAICPCAIRCSLVQNFPPADAGKDSEALLDQYVALEAATWQAKTWLTEKRRSVDADIISGPNAFGVDKPKIQKFTPTLYTIKTSV